MNISKTPPQALELEDAVIGAIMIEKRAMQMALSIIKDADVFYNPANQLLYSTFQKMYAQSQPIDIITVSRFLRNSGEIEIVGGAFGITKKTEKVNSAANLEFHSRLLQELFVKRKIAEIAGTLSLQCFDETRDAFQLLAEAQRGLGTLTDVLSAKQSQSALHLHSQAIDKLRDAMQQQGLTGVPSGIKTVDNVTGGWQKSDLIIIAARPGMGKSAIVVTLARNAAIDFGKPGAIFTLEMSSLQFMNRLISYESQGTGYEYTNSQLAKGRIGSEDELRRLSQISSKVATDLILIDDTPALPLSQLQAKCAKLKDTHGIEWVMVDYMQLMKGNDTRNREQEVAGISSGLKKMAKELDIPVIALAQLSRKVEERADKRPMLSDLRESGSIEQDADMVIFLYRDEYYNPEGSQSYNPELKDRAELIIAKHRSGSLADILLGCKIAHSKFYDPAVHDYFSPQGSDNDFFKTVKSEF